MLDDTYNFFKVFCKNTEDIMLDAIMQYDKNAVCRVIPNIDIGFPHDVIRVAGGFPTGCFIEWKCNFPFIPVDITLNYCTSSVYELDSDITEILMHNNGQAFMNLINHLSKSSYKANFHRGNHFILYCKGKLTNKYYLVVHTSAAEFKDGFNGLYPYKDNWFYNNIKTHYFKGRYIRYIIGSKAELFLKMAQQIKEYNSARQLFFADSLINGQANIVNTIEYDHYGMHDMNSVVIGSIIAKRNDIIPIFSDFGKDILLYKVFKSNIQLNNEEYLYPHGWGKESKIKPNLNIDMDNMILQINGTSYKIDDKESLRAEETFGIREFSFDAEENNYFKLLQKHVDGELYDQLKQIVSYNKKGFVQW